MKSTIKEIVDVLVEACHVPIMDVCVLSHDNKHFKAYVHGMNWYCQNVYDVLMNKYNIPESNILIEPAPGFLWFSSKGYKIEVTF